MALETLLRHNLNIWESLPDPAKHCCLLAIHVLILDEIHGLSELCRCEVFMGRYLSIALFMEDINIWNFCSHEDAVNSSCQEKDVIHLPNSRRQLSLVSRFVTICFERFCKHDVFCRTKTQKWSLAPILGSWAGSRCSLGRFVRHQSRIPVSRVKTLTIWERPQTKPHKHVWTHWKRC